MWVGAHPPLAFRRQLGELGAEPAVVVEKLLRLVALHPLFEDFHVRGIAVHLAHRDLVRAPVILDAFAVDLFWAGPAPGPPEHDHRPARPLDATAASRVGLNRLL